MALIGLLALLVTACGDDEGGTAQTETGDVTDATVSVSEPDGFDEVLVDAGGNTLYIAEGETDTNIMCTDACLSAWPPLTVPADQEPTAGDGVTGTLATATREDGTVQVTYDGQPLYTFASDGPGDVTGNGISDEFGGTAFTWRAIGPDGPAEPDSGGGLYDY